MPPCLVAVELTNAIRVVSQCIRACLSQVSQDAGLASLQQLRVVLALFTWRRALACQLNKEQLGWESMCWCCYELPAWQDARVTVAMSGAV
jgi:hypothetical protein